MKTLTITGLTKVFPVHDDVAEAVAADNAATANAPPGTATCPRPSSESLGSAP